ncbi:two-component system, OmpR family, phosphate regulon sensor histidine kinase PhoR [Gracilibacillus ureilyticus]|uniref:histidine kinase n=1 Tax=Gracilibacillus ureilyticus TaxID=531814 RepID=A0A1H9UEV2_9BACI|nr:HAMP domain-containing sensor histidine kinase [Gracilibacillus ureilyticus]SES07694.1 two-component system, OmpR family, phosphate regulon sensor histidine kinase PhoR [Gracilibacillus ureilyticus]
MGDENKGNLFLRYIVMMTSVFILIGIVVVPFTTGDDRFFVIFALAIGYIIVLVLMYHLFENYVKPIRASINVTNELVKGNYNVRTYVKPAGEAQQLSELINQLARNLQEMYIQEKMQGSQWKTVINNMESGLMLIDERGYVHLVNRKFLQMFGENSLHYIGYLYYDVLAQKSIHRVVQETFLYEEKMTGAITRLIDGQKHHIEVVGAPVINDVKELKGAVLVFHDITDLKRVEQMRKDFVANVSHELKTPITSIRGFSETLLDGAMEDEQLSRQFIDIILKESTRLQALVQDLLELSKLEKEELQLSKKLIEVDEWITNITTLIEQQVINKSIIFSVEVEEGITFYGDPDRLQQVVLNLLYNGINYTPEKGKIALLMSSEEEVIKVKVSDTGIGIPEDSIHRIFERFYRVDRARSRNTGGTGLGLAIVKHIVEAHKGKIEVESEVNKGTTFTVTLPKEW